MIDYTLNVFLYYFFYFLIQIVRIPVHNSIFFILNSLRYHPIIGDLPCVQFGELHACHLCSKTEL